MAAFIRRAFFAVPGMRSERQTAQDLSTARSILEGTHPDVATMDGIAGGKVAQATPEQRAQAASYASAIRQVAATYIRKMGYTPPAAQSDGPTPAPPPEKMANAREVTRAPSAPSESAPPLVPPTPSAPATPGPQATPTPSRQEQVVPPAVGASGGARTPPPPTETPASVPGGGDGTPTPSDSQSDPERTPVRESPAPSSADAGSRPPPEKPPTENLTNETADHKVDAQTDANTGARTRLLGRRVPVDTAGAISTSHARELGGERGVGADPLGGGSPAPATGEGLVEAQSLDQSTSEESTSASEQSASGQRRLDAGVHAKLVRLQELGGQAEGRVYADGQFAYKLYELRQEAGGSGTGVVGHLKYDENGNPVIDYRRGAARDIQEKALVLSYLGMPTEVHGAIAGTAEVVTKQPRAYQEEEFARTLPSDPPLDRSQIKNELRQMGAVRLPMSDRNSPYGIWLVNIRGGYYLVSDVKSDNVQFNSEGKPRLFDLVATPLQDSDFERSFDLAQARRATRPLTPNKPF